MIGFHAQQAVEKAIKAVLVASGIAIPHTHDLGFLLDILVDHTISVPGPLADADWLSPWAVAARYGVSDAVLDRDAAVVVADNAVAWADATIDFGV